MSVTVSISRINPIVGSFEQNLHMIDDAIDKAKNNNANIIIFPELALTRYPSEDLLFRPTFIKKHSEMTVDYPISSHNRRNLT